MPNNYPSLKRKSDPIDLEAMYINDSQLGYDQEYYGANSSGGIEKKQIFKFLRGLRKHWLIITSITLLITSAAIVYEAQISDYYTAEVRVQINNEVNPGASGTSVIVANPGNDPTYFATQLQILEGAGLLRRVVKTIDLENNQTFFQSNKKQFTVTQNVLRMFGLYKPSVTNQKTEIPDRKIEKNNLTLNNEDTPLDSDIEAEKLSPYVSYLQSNLKIIPVKDKRTAVQETRLIEIDFTHNDPVMAAKLVNTIADTYALQNLEQKVQTNASAGDFLQKRVAELQSLIRLGEERLINYGKSNQILSLDTTQNTVVQRLSDLNAKLGQAENDRITAETAYRATLQNPSAGTIAEDKDPRTTNLEGQLTTLRQKLAELKTQYTDDWPEVVQIRRQIETIENELQINRKRASSTQLSTLEQNYKEAFVREKELRSNFEKQRNEVLAQNEAAINYRIIQQEIETNKTLLDDLLQRSRQNDVILNGTPNNVRIVDRALTPRLPTGPQRSINIIMAFIISLMVGVGLSTILTWLNDTITSSDDLEFQAGLPIIGLIPAADSSIVKKLQASRLLKGKHGEHNVYNLESFEKPVIAESYLQLRTQLLLSTPGGPPQTILITSGQAGEGKTVTALNLAQSLAQTGVRVLLIDADLRYPRIHTIYKLSNITGLTNLLTGKEFNQDTINDIVQKKIDGNLDILTAGPNAPNPANILGSNQMRDLLNSLKTQYSHIVIDSPPILYFADSIILSTYVDAVSLVARCNKTSLQTVLLARKKLQDINAKIIGVILNGIPLKGLKYHNYGYYNHLETAATEDQGILHIN